MTLTEAFKRRILSNDIKLLEVGQEMHVLYDTLRIQNNGGVLEVELCQGEIVVARFETATAIGPHVTFTLNGLCGSIPLPVS